MCKQSGTPIDRNACHIYADVFGITGALKLSAVTAAKFDDRLNVLLSNKIIQNFCLELRQPAIGTRSRSAAFSIHCLPKRTGSRKCKSSRTCKHWKLREPRGGWPDHGNAFDKFL